MKKVRYSILAICFTALTTIFTSCAAGQNQKTTERTVSVTGTGTVYCNPDRATITLAVNSTGKDVQTASSDNAVRMTAVQKALIDSGIAKDDISTSNYNIYRQSSWQNGRTVQGDYQVTNQVEIIVHDIQKCGSTIDIAIKAGANELSSISFDISDNSSVMRQARILAVQKASEKAKLFASASGAQLGQVLTITEDSGHYSPASGMLKVEATRNTESAPTPVSVGKTQVSATVHMTYALQ